MDFDLPYDNIEVIDLPSNPGDDRPIYPWFIDWLSQPGEFDRPNYAGYKDPPFKGLRVIGGAVCLLLSGLIIIIYGASELLWFDEIVMV